MSAIARVINLAATWTQQGLAAISAQQAAAKLSAQAAEQQRAAAQRESLARDIDNRMRGPYSAIADTIFSSITRAGMCASTVEIGSGITCATLASYTSGQLAPINLSFNVRRQQFVTLSISPQNERRSGSISGAVASLTVQSVFEHVDITSTDEVRFHSSIRTLMASMLRAFNVPDQVLSDCRRSTQGVATIINGTTVSCHLSARPSTNGGLAQFTLNLARPL